jgi:hypothetical protein
MKVMGLTILPHSKKESCGRLSTIWHKKSQPPMDGGWQENQVIGY